MEQSSDNHTRVAKNTLFLYMRLFFLMAINLYTSRVILNSLGVDDYGVHNVVAGFVAMFAMFSNTFSSAIGRFITFSLGRDGVDRTKVVFSNALFIQATLSLLVLVIGETGFVWWLNHKMTIPDGRLYAANVVLQLSLASFILNLFRTPYDACIVAHERMSVYAYLGILEGIVGLAIALVIKHSSADRLILYTLLNLVALVVIMMMYYAYCRRHFKECRLVWAPDRKLLREMIDFSGWNFFSVMAGVLRGQGINMLLNMFCGPAVNAARGLAVQVNTAVSKFASGFVTAINPQITKNYASKNKHEYETLTMKGSKITFLLLFLACLPVMMEAEFLLRLWLGHVPDHTRLFVVLILCQALVNSFSNPLITLILATAKIKKPVLLVGITTLLNFPIAYVLLWLGFFPESTVCCVIVMSVAALGMRLYCLRELTGFPVRRYIREVLLVALRVAVLSLVVPLLLNMLWADTHWLVVAAKIIVMEAVALTIVLTLGLNRHEREFVFDTVRKKLFKSSKS